MKKVINTSKKQSGRKFLTVMLTVVLVIVVVIGAVSGLVLSDPNAEKRNETITPSSELAKKILTSAVTGNEIDVTADELNGFLESKRLLSSTVPTVKGAVIGRTILSIRQDNTADAYIPVQAIGKTFGVSINFIPSCDVEKGQLVLHVQAVKIGRLPVNPAWAFAFVKDALPDGFTVNGTDIRMNSSVFKFKYAGVEAGQSISSLQIENGLLKIKTKSNLSGSLFGIFS